jgi:hypothetical protein
MKMSDAIQTSDSFADNSISSSIEFDIVDLFMFDRQNNSQTVFHVVVNYEESSYSNKRSFVKKSRSVQNSSVSQFMFDSIANDDRRRYSSK